MSNGHEVHRKNQIEFRSFCVSLQKFLGTRRSFNFYDKYSDVEELHSSFRVTLEKKENVLNHLWKVCENSVGHTEFCHKYAKAFCQHHNCDTSVKSKKKTFCGYFTGEYDDEYDCLSVLHSHSQDVKKVCWSPAEDVSFSRFGAGNIALKSTHWFLWSVIRICRIARLENVCCYPFSRFYRISFFCRPLGHEQIVQNFCIFGRSKNIPLTLEIIHC